MAKLFPDTASRGKWKPKTILQTARAGLSAGVASVINTFITRENTQKGLASKGMLRPSSQVNNDLELMNQRKPKDIGDPDRIAGEE